MTVLRWILITALLVAFLLLAVANWTPVPFRLPDGATINIRLPLLLAAAFIAGWLPTWLVHLGSKSAWKRRLAKAERSIDDALSAVRPTTTATRPTLPDQAQPMIVPPAGA